MTRIRVPRTKGALYHCPNHCGARYTHDAARDHVLNTCPKRPSAAGKKERRE